MPNPFAALDIEEEGAQRDVLEVFKFDSLVPDVKVELSDSNFQTEKYNKFPSLLACSSKYGFFITGSHKGFELGQTKLLRDTIYKAGNGEVVPFNETISVPVKEGSVDVLALTADDLQLIVGVSGGIILTYNISDIVKNKEKALPIQTQKLDSDIIFIQPNPEEYRDLLVVITQENDCKLIRYMTNEIICTIPEISCVCWSPLGKQFMCGTLGGLLEAYNIQGNKKDSMEPPSSLTEVSVNAVVWVESHVFLAIYANEDKRTPYIINRKLEEHEKYKLLDEVNPIYDIDCPDSHFYFAIIRDFGEDIKTLITLANTAAASLAIIGQSNDGSWATWIMGESSINLPLSDDDISDTYPVGLAIDFSASEPLPPYDSAESEAPVSPMPVVFFMTNEGRVCAYHAYSFELAKNNIKYDKMVEAQDVYNIPEPANFPTTPEATATVDAANSSFSSFDDVPTKIPSLSRFSSIPKPSPSNSTMPSSAFGFNTANATTSYGQTGFGKKPSAEETSTAKPAENTVPKFGRTSSIGQAAAHAFGAKSSEHKNPFGSKPFDVDSLIYKKPAVEQEEQSSKKSTEVPDKKDDNEGCTLSFDSVKKDIDFDDDSDNDSEVSKVSSIDKSKDAFGFPNVSNTLDKAEEQDDSANEESEDSLKSEEDDDIVIVREQKDSDESPENDQLETEDNDTFEKEEGKEAATVENEGETTEDNANKEALNTEKENEKSISKSEEEDEAKDEGYQRKDKSTEAKNGKSADDKETDESSSEEDSSNDTIDESEKDKPLDSEEEQSTEENEKLKEENRIAKEKNKKREEEERAAEEERLQKERAENEKIAEEKRKSEEAERIEREKAAEEERIAEEKRREEERIAEEKRREEERIAEEKRHEEARLAAMRQTPVLNKRERVGKPTIHERAVGIKGIAREFEAAYFNTIEELESTSLLLYNIKEDISIQIENDFASLKPSALEDLDFEWVMDDMYEVGNMTDDLNKAAETAEKDLLGLYDFVSSLLDSVNNLKIEDIRSCLETKDDFDKLKSTIEDDSVNQIKELEDKLSKSKNAIEALEEKLNDYKQSLSSHKSNSIDGSKLTTYALRRTIREIEKSISLQCRKINSLEKEELLLRTKESNPKNTADKPQESNSVSHLQRKSFIDQMFHSAQQFNPLNV